MALALTSDVIDFVRAYSPAHGKLHLRTWLFSSRSNGFGDMLER
jgi:hypothetical protein